MATIKGKWKWEQKVEYGQIDGEPRQVNFSSNGSTYSALSFRDSTGAYQVLYDNLMVIDWKYDDETGSTSWYWYDEAYRVIDFGAIEQTIDDTFYQFLIDNATRIPNVEFLGDVKVDYDLRIEGSAYVGDKKVLVEGDAVNVVIPEEVQVTTLTIGETTIDEELLKKLLTSANIEGLMGEYGEASF